MGDTVVSAASSALSLMSASASLSLPSLSLSIPKGVSLILPSKKAITVTTATSCSEPAFSGDTGTSTVATILGTDLSSDGGGSCQIKASSIDLGSLAGQTVILNCDAFNGGSSLNNMSMDGKLGILIEETTSTSASVQIKTTVSTLTSSLSEEFLLGFIENGSTKICNMTIDFEETVTITVGTSSATYSDSVSGCISACDQAFNLSGTKTGSFTF
ncbi:MAG: hypothetical protein HYV02_02835 [Deltaproteobacteria bacterium]|nr:hypothetical protein [Deltaproteobacteria bacterium]